MKISIGTNVKDGPWGGGNLFAINLTNYLHSEGHEVVSNLKDDDIDIKKYKQFSDDFKAEIIGLNNIEELENFQSIVLIANSGKFKSKNLYIINKYLNIYKNRIKASFFVKHN